MQIHDLIRHRGLRLRTTAGVLQEIRSTIGATMPESGGVLGGSRAHGIVTHFHFDRLAQVSSVTYSPDCESVNRLLAESWNPKDIDLLGMVHSHYAGIPVPSEGDRRYAEAILNHLPELDHLFLPIVIARPDGGEFHFLPYVAIRTEGRVVIGAAPLDVIDDQCMDVLGQAGVRRTEPCHDGKKAIDITSVDASVAVVTTRPEPRPVVALDAVADPAFTRVLGAYDLARMARARVIAVGAGGAAGFIEDMARTGVGSLVLIDPDVIELPNIATQQTFRKDVGRPKVEAVADRVRDINPRTEIVARQDPLDALSDEDFAAILSRPVAGEPPSVTLLCGFTDNFFAQARVNRLALQFGLPSLCAQVYQEGRGIEVTFTYPGVTVACHRCMLSSRYRAYLEEHFENAVTSAGTPIFATTRLNAIKGFIALALLHHGTSHPRWGGLLSRIGHRTLLQCRLCPDIATTLGLQVFDRVFKRANRSRLVFDEVVWLPQKPELNCPDCGGTGDLAAKTGTFNATRLPEA